MKDGFPIYTFDEHHEAFYFWHKAKQDGFLNEPLDLFHVDAHADMAPIGVLQKSLYYSDDQNRNGYSDYYNNLAQSELHIGNFIFPAILNGLIKNVYFVYPSWRNFKPRRKRMNVGSAFGEGKILKSNLKVGPGADPKVSKVYPDLHSFLYSMQTIDGIPKRGKVILDIDLDYFACRDSVLNGVSYELEITPMQFQDQELFLEDKTLPFSRLEFQFIERGNRFYAKVGHRKGKDVSYLPTEEEIDGEIQRLVETLRFKKVRPVIITICRSCLSNYCPKEYIEFIEKRLIIELRSRFPS